MEVDIVVVGVMVMVEEVVEVAEDVVKLEVVVVVKVLAETVRGGGS